MHPTQKSLGALRQSLAPNSSKVAHGLLYPALALAAGGANAAVMYGTGPLTVTDGTPNTDWNIDGVNWTIGPGDSDADPDEVRVRWGTCADRFNFLTDGGGLELLPVTPLSTVGPAGSYNPCPCEPSDSITGTSNTFGFLNFPAPVNGELTGVFGFRFDPDGGADTWLYGIAEFRFDDWDGDDPIGTFTITRWAWEDSGAAISGNALAVPVAPTGALMALALAGMAARRRKRSQSDSPVGTC